MVLRKATCRGRVRSSAVESRRCAAGCAVVLWYCGAVGAALSGTRPLLQSGKQTQAENVCKLVRMVLADTSALESG
jgi:hypothetical protein